MSSIPRFAHLHLHSEYSLLDGCIRAADLAAHLERHGMEAAAVTDHGSLFGAIEFYDTLSGAGLKPIIGMEAYLAPAGMAERSAVPGRPGYYHLTLLALDEEGYRNLCRLSSIGYIEGFHYKPRIDREVLSAHSRGLAIGSACLQGEVAQHLSRGDEAAAEEAVRFYTDLVGRERYFIELMDHGLPEERGILRSIVALAERTGALVAATNDAHYLERSHASSHDILLCVQTNKRMDDPGRMRFGTDEFYVKSPLEMSRLFDWLPASLENTAKIAEMCEFRLERGEALLPGFPLPEGRSMDSALASAARDGLRSRLGRDLSPAEEERLSLELSVISEMGFPGYFLIVSELRSWAGSRGIAMGPGRGSAAGSLVSYATGITDINPLEHGLSFERFLNPSRRELPDIDLDFCFNRRPEVIEHLVELYGRSNVCQIVTFNRMKAKLAARDVGRALGLPLDEVDRFTKLLDQAQQDHDNGETSLRSIIEGSQRLSSMVAASPGFADMARHCEVLENIARNTSVHAAGVIIAPGDLSNFVPLCRQKEGITTQYEMKSLDRVGLLKLDVLGLRTVTVLQQAESLVRRKGVDAALDRLPLDDPETLAMLAEGDTTAVFQLESSGMRDALRRIGVSGFKDITAAVAMFRPGPMQMIELYAQNKRATEKGGGFRVKYLHPDLEEILSETYGVMIYQEQVMAIANRLAGMSMSEADTLRKAMSKKDPAVMTRQRERFMEGAQGRGVPREIASQVWEQIEKFAGYGFNKAHAVSYAMLAYRTAWLKAHHPAEFLVASMNSEIGNIEKLTVLVEECRRLGLEVHPPSVNRSGTLFEVGEDGSVIYALSAIRNVGEGPCGEIVRERLANGPYKSLFDFCARIDQSQVNRRVLESLAGAGALDCLAGSRSRICAAIESASEYGVRARLHRQAGQMSLFSGPVQPDGDAQEAEPELPDVPEMSCPARLNLEKSLLGFYLSGHPMDDFSEDVSALADVEPGADLPLDRRRIRMAGVVASRREIPTKNGNMAFVVIEGRSGSTEVIAFSEVLQAHRNLLEAGVFVMVEGEVTQRRDERRLSLTSVCPIEEARRRYNAGVTLRLVPGAIDQSGLEKALDLLRSRPGRGRLTIEILNDSGWRVRAVSRSIRIAPDDSLLAGLRDILGSDAVKLAAGTGT